MSIRLNQQRGQILTVLTGHRKQSSRGKLLFLLAFYAFLWIPSLIAQPGNTNAPQSIATNTAVDLVDVSRVPNEFLTQKLQLQLLDSRIASLAKETDRRFDWEFKVFGSLSAVGSVLVLVLTVANLIRQSHEHKSYKSERQFYEDQVRRKEDKESAFTKQQLSVGQNVADNSGTMLQGQIDNIVKLGSVITLVEKSYALQAKREEAQGDFLLTVHALQGQLKQLQDSFRLRYEEVKDAVMVVEKLSAMDWPKLADEQRYPLRAARATFNTLPPDLLVDLEKKEPAVLAHVQHLLGVSAFYENDVTSAEKQLTQARRLYTNIQVIGVEVFPKAYTEHFLGLIKKNWRDEKSVAGLNMHNAKTDLEKANDLLKTEKDQFLTRVTLVEILSYIKEERQNAEDRIDEIIKELEAIRDDKKINANQLSLLVRSYLLRGNLDFFKHNNESAGVYYNKAKSVDPKNHNAILSIAQMSSQVDVEQWQKGLKALEDSGALKKKETSTRVTALVWTILASNRLKTPAEEGLLKELKSIGSNYRKVGHWIPLFFSPISKCAVTYQDLEEELKAQLGETAFLTR